MKFIPLPVLFVFFAYLLPAQTIRYVKHDATGTSNGTSWANAFIRLQQALAVAQDGDEIWVAKGMYKPTTTNDRFVYYDLPSGVKVYGGFVGTEISLEQRDWAANPTILSGDIGAPGDSTDNSFNILYSYSPNEKTLLDGLIFEEGNANNTDPATDAHRPTRSGGGIYLDGENFGYAQLSVSNCIFRRNRATHQGGGIYANGREGGMAIIRLDNCLFERNISSLFGGGLSLENYFEQPFELNIKRCVFKDNRSFSSGNAIWLRAHQTVRFSDCTFINNRSISGGTVFFTQLQSIHPVDFNGCLFEKNSNYVIHYNPNNQAINEGAFKFKSCVFKENGLPVVTTSVAKGKATIEQCIFSSNESVNGATGGTVIGLGGASNLGDIIFANTLFFNNIAREISATTAQIINCIIIDEANPGFASKGIFTGNTCSISNSLFRVPSCDSIGTNWPNTATILCDSSNLFNTDPLFVNPSASDFHLQSCSPAINAGTNAILNSLGITTDIEGNPRIRNTVVDMGPYEKHISLHPSVSAQPTCAGTSDGAIKISPALCPPFSLTWDNGDTTGTNISGLAAGTYVFTATGANNIPITDTLLIDEPFPVEVMLVAHDVQCPGTANGWIDASANGGTSPYLYTWDGILTPFNLPPGTYSVTATDVNGCTGSAQAAIGSPDPVQFFYTVQNASCMGCSNGSIVFDSVVGGTNPPLPAPMFNLPAGVYCVTVTDDNACTSVVCITVNVSSSTQHPSLENLLKISPNPTVSGHHTWIEWTGNETVTLRVYDAQGRLLSTDTMAPNTSKHLNVTWPAGIYQMEFITASGQRLVRRWVIG
jgi:predicted outer membrane repeat protein